MIINWQQTLPHTIRVDKASCLLFKPPLHTLYERVTQAPATRTRSTMGLWVTGRQRLKKKKKNTFSRVGRGSRNKGADAITKNTLGIIIKKAGVSQYIPVCLYWSLNKVWGTFLLFSSWPASQPFLMILWNAQYLLINSLSA